MSGIEISAQERKLLARCLRIDFSPHNMRVTARDAPLATGRHELVCENAYGHTGRAPLAGGPIGDHLAAAEPGMGEGLVELLGQRACEAREDFAFDSSRQIGTGAARGQEKLRQSGCTLVSHGNSFRRTGYSMPMKPPAAPYRMSGSRARSLSSPTPLSSPRSRDVVADKHGLT